MARRRPPTVHGVLVIDKPAGVTSHDVVAMVRRRFGERRVGHAGTLDPDATGVLVVALGSATRLIRFISDTTKVYSGEIVFGTETDTLDSSGTVTATYAMGPIDIDEVRRVVTERFTGDIEQIPPMVSAIKVDGRRLHELARQGIEVERQPRPVTIHSFEVDLGPSPEVVVAEISCSAGTYIRSLAADLGQALGGGAHLRRLRRLAVGSFTVDSAAGVDEAELLPVEVAVAGLERVVVDAETAGHVAHGRVLDRFDGDGPWAVFSDDGRLLAVYAAHGDGRAKPEVVLVAADGR